MGNDVGKTIGIVAGAACQLIPGVGTVAGIGLFALASGIGSGVDALVDSNRQNGQADEAAQKSRKDIEAERRRAEIELERRRIEETRRLEAEAQRGREQNALAEYDLQREAARQIADRERLQETARNLERQVGYVNEALMVFAAPDVTLDSVRYLPGVLDQMDDEHFELFRQRALASCATADAREICQMMLENEEMRREVAQGWEEDLNQNIPAARV